jgi:hypothetical protein
MKQNKRLIGALVFPLIFLGATHAGAATLEDVANKVTISGQVRVRSEFRKDLTQAVPAVPGPAEEDVSVLLRTRLGLQFDPTEHLRFFIQAQDARDFGEEAAAVPIGLGDDEGLDLHQGYIEYSNIGDSVFNARIGRQEILFGDQRLVGNVDWSNVGRSFDGGRLDYNGDHFNSTLFASVFNKTAAGDQALFGGLYNTWKGFPKGVLDFYYLAMQDNDGAAGVAAGTGNTLSAHTVGVRVKSDPGRFDLGAEIAAQLGKFGSNSIFAYAGHGHIGYTFEDDYKPKLLVEYNYATGDDGVGGRYTKFTAPAPTMHNKYGYADLVTWSNMHDGRLEFSVMPAKKWKLALDYHLFLVDKTTGDTFAGIAGVAGVGKIAGHEGDVTLGYTLNEYASFLAGYSLFLPGAYLKDQGITAHSDFAYVQAEAHF